MTARKNSFLRLIKRNLYAFHKSRIFLSTLTNVCYYYSRKTRLRMFYYGLCTFIKLMAVLHWARIVSKYDLSMNMRVK